MKLNKLTSKTSVKTFPIFHPILNILAFFFNIFWVTNQIQFQINNLYKI